MAPFGAWVFDVDGTLLDSRTILRPRTAAALDALHEHGSLMLVATALGQRGARGKLTAVPYLCERGVFLAGGHVVDEPTGYTHEVLLDAEVGRQVLQTLESVSPELQILVQYGSRGHARRLELDPELVAVWGYEQEEPLPYGSDVERPFTRVIAWHMGLDLGPAYESLRAQFRERVRIYLTNGNHVLQASAPEATKGQGLQNLFRYLAIDPADAIAFGDSATDLEMFELVGTSVAMGNAPPEVKAAATMVTESNDEEGVAAFIERLLRR